MKRTGILLLIISIFIGSSAFVKEVTVENDVNALIKESWEFHEIILRTHKDGYLMTIAKKEVEVINLMIANYTFNKDGSITLDADYMEKQGVKEAKWEMNSTGSLAISYLWTPEKQKASNYSNNYEKIEFKIDKITDKELIFGLYNMFFVKLIRK